MLKCKWLPATLCILSTVILTLLCDFAQHGRHFEPQPIQTVEVVVTENRGTSKIPELHLDQGRPTYSVTEEPVQTTDHIESRHRCLGNINRNPDNWMQTTCHFYNLCYDPQRQGWIYIQKQSSRRVRPREITVNLAAYNKWAGDPAVWNPEIVDMFPQDAEFVSGFSMLYGDFNAFNFGHFLFDNLFPVYQALKLFGESPSTARLIRYIKPEFDGWWNCAHDDRRNNACNKMFDAFFPLFTDLPVRLENETADVLGNGKAVCFENLVAGLGYLTDHCWDVNGHSRSRRFDTCNVARSPVIWEFRNYLMNRAKITPAKLDQQSRPRVLFWIREHDSRTFTHRISKRNVGNMREVIDGVDQLDVDVQIVRDWTVYSLEEQMAMVSESIVFVSSCGGGALVSVFLPRGATLILLCPPKRHYDGDLYTHISYFRTYFNDIVNNTVDSNVVVNEVKAGLENYKFFR